MQSLVTRLLYQLENHCHVFFNCIFFLYLDTDCISSTTSGVQQLLEQMLNSNLLDLKTSQVVNRFVAPCKKEQHIFGRNMLRTRWAYRETVRLCCRRGLTRLNGCFTIPGHQIYFSHIFSFKPIFFNQLLTCKHSLGWVCRWHVI